MDVGTDASTIPISVLIRLLLVILMMTPMNWPMIPVAVVMTMTGAVIFVASLMAKAWHMLFIVTWAMAMTVAVVIIDRVVEITARVLVIANHAAADRVDKDALIVAESRKIED